MCHLSQHISCTEVFKELLKLIALTFKHSLDFCCKVVIVTHAYEDRVGVRYLSNFLKVSFLLIESRYLQLNYLVSFPFILCQLSQTQTACPGNFQRDLGRGKPKIFGAGAQGPGNNQSAKLTKCHFGFRFIICHSQCSITNAFCLRCLQLYH